MANEYYSDFGYVLSDYLVDDDLISVHWPTSIIQVPKYAMQLTQSNPTEIWKLDLDSFRLALRDLEDEPEGMTWLKTHNHTTETVLGGLSFARVVEILTPYTITFENAIYSVDLLGANSNVGDKVNPNQVSVRAYNSAGLLSSQDIEYASFNGGVTIDVINGEAGTTGGIGKPNRPVNNVPDAMLIASVRGLTKLYIIGDITFTTGDNIDNMIVVGESTNKSLITILDAANTPDCEFENGTITGILDGGTIFNNCNVGNVTYVNGTMESCGLYGTIALAGSTDAIFKNCSVVDPNDTPIIDMGGTGQDATFTDWSGQIEFKNLSSNNKISMQIDGGRIILDSTISDGTIGLYGIGVLVDNATSYTALITDGLLNRETITKTNWDIVHISEGGGSSGTAFPLGTAQNPSDNWTDVLAIAVENNISLIHVMGDTTLTTSVGGYSISSNSVDSTTVTLNDQDIDVASFTDVTITGDATGHAHFSGCDLLTGFTGINAQMNDCALDGTFTIANGGEFQGTNCSAVNAVTINMNGTSNVGLGNFGGFITIANSTNAANVIGVSGTYLVVLDTSITAGQALIGGIGIVQNFATSFTSYTNITIPATVWDQTVANHLTAGTFGAELATKADIQASTSTDYTAASSGTAIYGSVDTGTYADTATRDNVYWEIHEDGTNGITVEYVFNLPSTDHKPGVFSLFGRYAGQPALTHFLDLWAYNYETTSWELLINEFMPGGNTSDLTYSHEYYERHVDRTNSSEVKIRLIHNVTTYNASHELFMDYTEVSSIEVITAADIADAVWDEDITEHTATDSTGKTLSLAGSGGVDYGLLADAIWDDDITNRVTSDSAGLALFKLLSAELNETDVIDNGDGTKTVKIYKQAGSPDVHREFTISIVGDTESRTAS